MMTTNELAATRIAKQQSHDLMRAAARQRLARNATHDAATHDAAASRQHADLASRVRALGLSLSSARRSGAAAWRPAADDA